MYKFLKNTLEYFPQLDINSLHLFEQMERAYNIWNEKINLISRKDIQNFYERHLLHSLMIYKIVQFESGSSVVDVGTGGGLPGIPLAILFPNVKFFLVDSITKKAIATENIVKELGLKNISVYNNRFEQIDEKFDYIIGRAVTNLNDFISLVQNNLRNSISNSGIYYLSGKTEVLKLHLQNFNIEEIPCSKYFKESFFEAKYLFCAKKLKNI